MRIIKILCLFFLLGSCNKYLGVVDQDYTPAGELKDISNDNLIKSNQSEILENDSDSLQSLSLDENFIFKDMAKIFFLNLDLSNYSKIYYDNSEDIENFFLKAVSRYNNENN